MKTAILASLERLAHDLHELAVRWALTGGFAVSARAQPRFTRDVDVCVLVEKDEVAERLASALIARGYAVRSMVEHEKTHRLATLRLVSPLPGGVLVDLLFASSGVEPEVVEAAEPLEVVPGVIAPVAVATHLVVLKLLAHDKDIRPQDGVDLRALRGAVDPEDAGEAIRLARLITARGYDRDRDLVSLVQSYFDGIQEE